jgi:hypothetical protein
LEEIGPGETLESYFGHKKKTKKQTLDTKPLNEFILRNYGLGIQKYKKTTKDTNNTQTTSKSVTDPFKEIEQINQKFNDLNKLSIHDSKLQEEIHKLLEFTARERRMEAIRFKEKAHFPLRFTPNLNSNQNGKYAGILRRLRWSNMPIKYSTDLSTLITRHITQNYKRFYSSRNDAWFVDSQIGNGHTPKELFRLGIKEDDALPRSLIPLYPKRPRMSLTWWKPLVWKPTQSNS